MKNKTVKIGKKEVELVGRFQLRVRTDEAKFRMTNIDAFIPVGKTIQDRIQFMSKSGMINSLFITKVRTIFDPDKSDIDAHNVDVFIRHPNVKIVGLTEQEDKQLIKDGLKNSNPKFELINIDKVADEKHDDDIKLLQLRSKIYDEKNPLSKEQCIWLASTFGIPYRTAIQDEVRYKNHLQRELDKFIQRDKNNRVAFVEALDNLKLTEMKYYLNEFENSGHISEMGGIYKLGAKPIGSSINSVISYFENNPSEFQMLKEEIIQNNRNTVLS
jgi:hypothetical protein